MKILVILTLISSINFARGSDEDVFVGGCAAQIASLVQSAHQAPGKTMRNPVFNKKQDEQLIAKLKVWTAASTDPKTRANVEQNFAPLTKVVQ